MFFIGIMGVDTKAKEIKDIHNITCKYCGRLGMYKFIKQYNYFHFFFIPLFRWGVKYFLVSRCCHSVFSISKEKGKRLEDGTDGFVDSDELHYEDNNRGQTRNSCPHCGNMIDASFDYCPRCGNKAR
ncbi:zinc ribbon family protein [Alkalibaculum bacchi]|jgi:hypothetical protein|uniref:Zinc ribbon family protein n=1 Tax=Alkalibaculum bacchi TaxID=645887 RepID=A0A366IBV5_9FIRM|nr:zinc ribbon domain-containing protein [Alkalibaculum bacchi]RBP68256.1 zinc ribbon family protein [Alkalibaculum bacchi]